MSIFKIYKILILKIYKFLFTLKKFYFWNLKILISKIQKIIYTQHLLMKFAAKTSQLGTYILRMVVFMNMIIAPKSNSL